MAVTARKIRDAALRFLKTGRAETRDRRALSAECDRIIRAETEKSSVSAVNLARSFVRHAARYDHEMSLTAYRALGWALLVAGKYAESERTYLRARELARRKAEIRARIDRALIDVYMYLGRFAEAQRRARTSLATLRRLGAEAEIAKTRVNYANLLHRQDRHREAGKLYREAGAYFEGQGMELPAALSYYNEANTLVQFFEFDRAASLYGRARAIFLRHGYSLRANGCQYGLAWLHMLEGNYHIALRELHDCEQEYLKAAQSREVVLCRLDRAESFLGLNLFPDARAAAREAEQRARKLGIGYEAAKAALFFAKASAAIGRERAARTSLRRAESGFRKENNEAFLGAVELVKAHLESRPRIRTHRLDAARKRFTRAQLPLWEAICDLQYADENPDDTRVYRRLTANPAMKAVPHLFAKHHTMLGDREMSRGRLAAAVKHWQSAADVLDAVRAKLPPLDMRSSFARQSIDPYKRLIKAGLPDDPVTAAAWSERRKTAGPWATSRALWQANPARQKAEQSLAELAAQVTALSQHLSGTPGHRAAVGSEVAGTLERLQRLVRQDLAALEERTEARAERIETIGSQIKSAAAGQGVVQFHIGNEELIAFVHESGGTRFHSYEGGIGRLHELTSRWRFLLERAPYLKDRPGSAVLEDERQLLAYIGEWLWAPLEIPASNGRLLIIPEGELTNLPWMALSHHGEPLAMHHELTFSPSLRHHLLAAGRRGRSDRIAVFVGPASGDLRTKEEYSELQQLGGEAVTVYNPCRRSDWPDEGSYRIWHFTGHAELRGDNPFYSSLSLSDGPIFAADFRLKRNHVEVVTLAACRTGEQTHQPGEESTGFVRSMLEMGARNVIASQWAVHDRSTVSWMSVFYRDYFGGAPIGGAVRRAALEIRERYPLAYHWAAFSAFGAGR